MVHYACTYCRDLKISEISSATASWVHVHERQPHKSVSFALLILYNIATMKSAVLFSLSALALAAPTKDATSGSKVAFARARHQHKTRADGTVDMDWFLGTLKGSVLKYNKNFQLPEVVQNANIIFKRDTNAEDPLTDQVEGQEDEL